MSGSYGQLTTVLQRLGDGLALLNPVKLVSVAREALHELGTPPPGDPAALRDLAAAFRAAAAGLSPLALEVRRLPPPAGERHAAGLAGASFIDVTNATANAIGRAPEAFTTAAAALDALAEKVEQHQRTHADLRRKLREALHDATHLGSVPAPDPSALDDLTVATARLIRGSVRVYTEAIEAADRAAAVFADVAGAARAGAAWAAMTPRDSSVAAWTTAPLLDLTGTAVTDTATTRAAATATATTGTAITATATTGSAATDTATTGAAATGSAATGSVTTGTATTAAATTATAGGLSASDAIVLAARGVRVGGYDGGLLTVAQLRRAAERLDAMPAEEAARVRDALDGAGSGTERAYLFKALAAGHGPQELAAFAGSIRGRDDAWLHNHLTLIDRGGPGAQDRFGVEVDQCDEYTCGTTSAIVALAEADPVYALSLTSGLEAPYDQADREEFDRRLTAEQRRVHDATNTLWPERLGTLPAGIAGWLNGHAAATGTRYRWRLVDDTDRRDVSAALREVAAAADGGHPAPMLVGAAVPRHYVLVVGHAGDDLLIFEPTSGDTRRIPAADLLSGRLAEAAGFDHVQAVIVPSSSPGATGDDVTFRQ